MRTEVLALVLVLSGCRAHVHVAEIVDEARRNELAARTRALKRLVEVPGTVIDIATAKEQQLGLRDGRIFGVAVEHPFVRLDFEGTAVICFLTDTANVDDLSKGGQATLLGRLQEFTHNDGYLQVVLYDCRPREQ